MTQEIFPDMPEKLVPASPSKLDTWLTCPRRFRFQYVDKPKPPSRAWAHIMLGISVHNALKEWWLLPFEKRTVDAARSLLRANWRVEGFRDVAQADATLDDVEPWVVEYVKTLSPDQEPRVEASVSFTTPTLNVTGRVDRIDARGEELVVVDYKTGRHPLTDDDARTSMALAMYVYGVRRVFKRESSLVELHHLPTGSILTFRHTPESLRRHLDRMEEIGREMIRAVVTAEREPDRSNEIFAAKPSPLCGWCDYWQLCPEGQAVSARKESWAGISSSESTPFV